MHGNGEIFWTPCDDDLLKFTNARCYLFMLEWLTSTLGKKTYILVLYGHANVYPSLPSQVLMAGESCHAWYTWIFGCQVTIWKIVYIGPCVFTRYQWENEWFVCLHQGCWTECCRGYMYIFVLWSKFDVLGDTGMLARYAMNTWSAFECVIRALVSSIRD